MKPEDGALQKYFLVECVTRWLSNTSYSVLLEIDDLHVKKYST